MTTDEELVRKAKNEYAKEWRKKNKERVKKYNNDYWLRKAKQAQESKDN